MRLPVADQIVDTISFDFRIEVRLRNGSIFTIETPFKILQNDGSEISVDPAEVEDATAVVRALRDRVRSADYDESGTLTIAMTASTWTVRQDANYESWHFASSDSPTRIVSGPTGSLAVWT